MPGTGESMKTTLRILCSSLILLNSVPFSALAAGPGAVKKEDKGRIWDSRQSWSSWPAVYIDGKDYYCHISECGPKASLFSKKGARVPLFILDKRSKDAKDPNITVIEPKATPYSLVLGEEGRTYAVKTVSPGKELRTATRITYESWTAPNSSVLVKAPRPEAPKPEVKPGAKPQPKPGVKPPAKPGRKPGAKPQPKPEVKPNPDPAAKPEPKPEPKPEGKPEAKPDPAAKPGTEPVPGKAPELSPVEKSIQDCLGKAAGSQEAKPGQDKPEKAPVDLKTKLSPDEYSEYLTLLGKMRGPKGAALAGKDKERWEALLKKAGVSDGKTLGATATVVKPIEPSFNPEAAVKAVGEFLDGKTSDPKLKECLASIQKTDLTGYYCAANPGKLPHCAAKKEDPFAIFADGKERGLAECAIKNPKDRTPEFIEDVKKGQDAALAKWRAEAVKAAQGQLLDSKKKPADPAVKKCLEAKKLGRDDLFPYYCANEPAEAPQEQPKARTAKEQLENVAAECVKDEKSSELVDPSCGKKSLDGAVSASALESTPLSQLANQCSEYRKGQERLKPSGPAAGPRPGKDPPPLTVKPDAEKKPKISAELMQNLKKDAVGGAFGAVGFGIIGFIFGGPIGAAVAGMIGFAVMAGVTHLNNNNLK